MDEFKEAMKRNWVEVIYATVAVLMVGYAFEATTRCITDILSCFD